MNCAADECGYNIGVGKCYVVDMDSVDWAEVVKPKQPITWMYGEQIVPWPQFTPYVPLWSKPFPVYTQTQEAQTNEHDAQVGREIR